MRRIEQRIIDKLIELNEEGLELDISIKKREELASLLNDLEEESLGKVTRAFLSNDILKKYLEDWICDDSIKFRILIENYLIATDDKSKQEFLSKITARITKIKKETFEIHGQGLMPEDINRTLIRNIYLSKDEKLIKLFSENLPIPSIEMFEGGHVPSIVQNRTEEATKAVLKFLEGRALSSVEPTITKVQRNFRAKRRQREERARIAGYPSIKRMEREEKEKKEFVEQALRSANTPYKPKGCSPELANKIFNAAKKVKLFSTVHHLTSEGHLENIFNDSLSGRRSLLQSYLPFKPAALHAGDLEYGGGDANVICFGPKDIDPEAIQEDSIDIVFDVDKLKENPCVFYKQRDLGYDPGTVRQVRIGKNETLSFSHTRQFRKIKIGFTTLQFLNELRAPQFYSQLPNYYFIAYNVPDMDQILTLNFFRFLDSLNNIDGSPDKSTFKSIYAAIEKLDEKELAEFLTNLGQQMTDTAEFNFYGAYKINFSAIQTIFSKKSSYTLNLPEFIKDLQSGNTEKLKEAREKIPNIFKSYRFIDYLISKVQNEAIQKQLLELRQACKVPLWMKEIQKQSEQSVFSALSSKAQPDIATSTSKHPEQKILQEDSKILMDKHAMQPTERSSESSYIRKSFLPYAETQTQLEQGARVDKGASTSSEALKSITKEEWNNIVGMHWTSSNANPKMHYSSEMSLKNAEDFRKLLKNVGIDINILSIEGDYRSKKYQVVFIGDRKKLTELTQLAIEISRSKPSQQ